MNDAVVGELGVALLVHVGAAQSHFSASVWVGEAVGGSDDPKWVEEGAATGTVDTRLGVMLVHRCLPWNLSELSKFSEDDRWAGRVVSGCASSSGAGGGTGGGL